VRVQACIFVVVRPAAGIKGSSSHGDRAQGGNDGTYVVVVVAD